MSEISKIFLVHYANSDQPIASEILVSDLPNSDDNIKALLRAKSRRAVKIHKPQRGIRARVLKIALVNMKHRMEVLSSHSNLSDGELLALKSFLNLAHFPKQIEAIDISELQGKHAVGSLVVFIDGKPAKKRYKRFKIRDEAATNDLDRIEEVLIRRFNKYGNPGWELPDLLLIDGGSMQLKRSLEVADRFPEINIPIIALVKDRNNRQTEAVILNTFKELPLFSGDIVKHLRDRVRDEAHRFALAYHRKLRDNHSLNSELLNIPGIGKKKRLLILESIGSIKELNKIPEETLSNLPGISCQTIRKIKDYLEEFKK